MKMKSAIAMFALAAACTTTLAAETSNPATEPMRVPLFRQAPTIDGRIDPDEWRGAHAFEGFKKMGNHRLEHRRVRGWVGATADTIYLAIQSQLPDEGELRAAFDRDTLHVVSDDSIEIYLNPAPDRGDNVDYQMLVNSKGFGGYHLHTQGNPEQDVSWRGDWTHVHGLHDGWWHAEIAIPVDSMDIVEAGRRTTDGVWAVNLCRNWASHQWSSLSGGGATYAQSGLWFTFTDESAPAVQVRSENHHAVLPNTFVLSAFNPSDRPMALHGSLLLERNVNPEVLTKERFTLAPGEIRELRVSADDPTTTLLDLTAELRSADGETVYYRRKTQWDRTQETPRWVVGPPPPPDPLRMRFAYFPSTDIMRVEANIGGMPEEARIDRIYAVVRGRWGGAEVKTVEFPLDAFVNGRLEQRFELPPLRGHYEVALKAEGENLPKNQVLATFERQFFPWEQTPTGRSTRVFPPFTPLELDGATLSSVLRRHRLNQLGLLDQVEGTSAQTGVSAEMLAAPMRYLVATADGEAAMTAEKMQVVSAEGHEVVTRGGFAAGPLRATWRNTWDYDGCVKVQLTLAPTGGEAVEQLTLEIPFTDEQATMIHANSDMIRSPVARRLSGEQGELWNGSQVRNNDFIANFTPYVFIGNPVRGLSWFAENDRNWGWDPETPNMRLVREGDRVVLRIHLINRPTVIDEERTITFGMLAAPVKPRLNPHAKENPNWWRYRYHQENYRLLGTDVNWFAVGNPYVGPFYPAGKDLYLWEMLGRSNRMGMSNDEVEANVAYGSRHADPGGEVARFGMGGKGGWVHHLRANLRNHQPHPNHPSPKMIFYYNRSAGNAAPDEFRTFRHEWAMHDFGEGGYLAPPESYINFTLYWFARSFEIGNNHGVYVDEWFFAPNTNTETTDAYRRADGMIVPATGVWALREWQKRTFIMMNERGMLPITFPHMTSFSPLPMMAFATMQYDWEWKYSTGDVQGRFPRDMLLLLSTGELAGVWPIPLAEHGAQWNDPWVQRTFAAVRILHELDGQRGHVNGTPALLQTVIAMLDKPGLDVYRYWDERPQPVRTTNPDIPTIVYAVPGKEALAAVVSYARQDEAVAVHVDLEALGLPGDSVIIDDESGKRFDLDADGGFTLPLKRHDIRLIRFRAAE